MHRTFGSRLRAALIGSGTSLLLSVSVLAAPALAADEPSTTAAAATQAIGPHTHQLHGTVKTAPSSSAATFTVTTKRYGDVTVSFAEATPKGHGHGHGQGKARANELTSLADLNAGARIVAQGRTSADGLSFIARRVRVLPATEGVGERATHLVGTVASADASSLTIKLADGSTQSVAISADTKIRPQGKTVTDLSAGTQVTVVSRNGTATAIVLKPA
jgi:hypothetical protein